MSKQYQKQKQKWNNNGRKEAFEEVMNLIEKGRKQTAIKTVQEIRSYCKYKCSQSHSSGKSGGIL